MSEPWDPQPAPEDAPGPHAELWTATYQTTDGLMRRVPLFASNEAEAGYWARVDTRPGETLASLDKGGTLSQAWSRPR